MNRIFIDTESDIPELTKKFEVEHFQAYPKAGVVYVSLRPVFFASDGRELSDGGQIINLTTGVGAPAMPTADNPSSIASETLTAIAPAIVEFATQKLIEQNQANG